MLLVLSIMGAIASSSVHDGHLDDDSEDYKEYGVRDLEIPGVANTGNNGDRSRTGRGGRGFWGQMANSNKNYEKVISVPSSELSVERSNRKREKIMGRTKSDSSLVLGKKKSLVKRVDRVKKKTKEKPTKRRFQNTASLSAETPDEYDTYVYDYDYEDYEHDDDNTHEKRITGEESRQYKRQALLDHM